MRRRSLYGVIQTFLKQYLCPEPSDEKHVATEEPVKPIDYYQLFINDLRCLTAEKPLTLDEICQETNLHKSQLKIWLVQAIKTGVIEKCHRPARYQIIKNNQLDLIATSNHP